MESHLPFISRCVELGLQARQTGNSPVGSLLVKEGIIVGEGQENTRPRGDITLHAEVEAIREAVRQLGTTDLSACTLYTTHEPCLLCSYVIRHHKIQMVVFAISSQHVGGFSSPYPLLTVTDIPIWGPPPAVLSGIGREVCVELEGY